MTERSSLAENEWCRLGQRGHPADIVEHPDFPVPASHPSADRRVRLGIWHGPVRTADTLHGTLSRFSSSLGSWVMWGLASRASFGSPALSATRDTSGAWRAQGKMSAETGELQMACAYCDVQARVHSAQKGPSELLPQSPGLPVPCPLDLLTTLRVKTSTSENEHLSVCWIL